MTREELLEKRRAEFEKWFAENYTAHKLSPKQTNCGILTDGYSDARVDLCWKSWNAALDSVEIVVPVMCDGNKLHEIGYDAGIEECIDSIQQQGFKVRT